ncbi:hypothetical protein FACS189425_00110 [Clostridia bacterium]|nr:hypothetical protein FACS189425_00110 [Clostridia bacterium]
MNKRELIYQIIIGFLVLTIVGMIIFPKPTPEPIIYTQAAEAGDEIAIDEEEPAEDDDTPTTTAKSTTTAKKTTTTKKTTIKPTAKPKASPTPGKITAAEGAININTGTKADLMRLPGIGEATAQKIIDYRDSHGDFSATIDIMKVSGIGEAKYEAMKDLIEI